MYYKCKIMINRINLILRAKNITARQFAEEIGIQPSGMSHILGGRNNPSLDFVSKVLRRYPEIDANWLLIGKGEMYSSSVPSTPAMNVSVEPPVEDTQPEPSLFDEEPMATTKVAEPRHEPCYQQDDVREEEQRYVPSYIASAPEPSVDNALHVERIVLIYSDDTYKVLHPQR